MAEPADSTQTEETADPPLFYLLVECPACDEDIVYGPCVTFMECGGLPIIPVGMGAQTSFTCGECGAEVRTGELEVF